MSENKITFPVKLASNNPQSFGIVDATEISGHRMVDTISDLYAISDPVLSILKDGSDAIGQEWFVVSEDCKYRLDNWENRKSVAGWTKLPKQELINTKQSVSEKDQPNGYAGLDSNGKLPIEKTYGATATVVNVATYESLPATGLSGVIYYVSNTSAQYKWSGSAYIDITDGADNAKKNETSIFDCSNGTSTEYYSSLSAAINVVPPVYRTSNRIISYLSVEYPQVELIVNKSATVDGPISIYLDGVLKSTISVTAGMTAIEIADKLSDSTYVDYYPWSWTDSGITNKFTLTYGDNNIAKKVTSYSYTADSAEESGLISFNILKEGFAPTAVNYQYHGIDSTTWTNLTKWERIPNQADLTELRSDLSEIETIVEQVKNGGLDDGSIELPKLSTTLAAYIGSGGAVTNQADDDDLENIIINGVPVIREKTAKTYNPETYSGMGRVILRKNMVNGVNVLTQEMINQANTIYEIRYDYNLNNQTITIPEGCILDMRGGSVTNGTINCVDTIIISTDDSKLDVTLTGTYRFDSEKLVTSNTEDINISQSVNRKSHTISAMLADRDTTNGMGYVILRKDKSFKEQVTQENTIYEIRYDFDLNTSTIAIPNNCVLKFEGGILKNGIIHGSNTSIQATDCFILSTEMQGTWNNTIVKSIWMGVKSDGIVDDTIALQRFFNFSKLTGNGILNQGTCLISNSIFISLNSLQESLNIKGDKTILKTMSFEPMIIIGDDNYSVYDGYGRFTLENINFLTQNIKSVCAIKIQQQREVHLKNIYIEGTPENKFFYAGIIVEGVWNNPSLENIRLRGCENGLLISGTCNNCLFEYVTCLSCTNGIKITGEVNSGTFNPEFISNKFIKCDFEGNDNAFLFNSPNVCKSIIIEDNHFESNLYSDIILSNNSIVNSTSISGCSIKGNTFAGLKLIRVGDNLNGGFIEGVLFVANSCYGTGSVEIGTNCPNLCYNASIFSNSYSNDGIEKNYNAPLYNENNRLSVSKVMPLYTTNPILPWGSPDTKGVQGVILYDDNYIYIKTSSYWKRFNLSIFKNGVSYNKPPLELSDAGFIQYLDAVINHPEDEKGQLAIWNGTSWVKTDGSPLKYKGLYSEKPTENLKEGCKYYCTDKKYFIIWNGVNWIEHDGEIAGINRIGNYANRPLSTSSIPPTNVGFQYYNTDTHKYMSWESNDKYYYADGTEALA